MTKPKPNNWKAQFHQLGPTGIAGIFTAIMPVIGSLVLFWYIHTVSNWLKDHHFLGILTYTIGFAVLSGLAFLPTYTLSVVAGWVFGAKIGIPIALIGCLGGLVISYLLSIRISGQHIVDYINQRPKTKIIYDALLNQSLIKATWIIALFRMAPNMPFALVNLFLASTRVNWRAFILGSILGMVPRCIIVVSVASQTQQLTETQSSPWWYYAIGAGMILLSMSVLTYLAKRALKQSLKSDT